MIFDDETDIDGYPIKGSGQKMTEEFYSGTTPPKTNKIFFIIGIVLMLIGLGFIIMSLKS